jgi:hypothetical protein
MMTRDEFELWLEENGPEAMEHIDLDGSSLAHWVRLFGKALALVAAQDQRRHSGESTVDDEDDDEDEPFEPDEGED